MLKTLEENVTMNDSEKQINICRRNLFETTKKELCYKQNRCLSLCRHLRSGYIRPKRLRS